MTIITDPFDKEIGLNPPRSSADIVTISHDHADHNNISAVSGEPFIVNGPGEYEVKGVRLTGCATWHDNESGRKRGPNTVYAMMMDEISICHLGDLGQDKLSDQELELIGEADILLIPVGGVYTIGPKRAAVIVNQIEPKLVIPMHYHLPGLKLGLGKVQDFLKEMGVNKKTPVERLTVKRKDLTASETKIVVMKP